MTAPQSNRSRVANAAAIVGALYLVTKLLGFGREIVFTALFGSKTLEAEALALVISIPDLVFVLISGGAIGSAFIPVFASYFADEENPDSVGAWQLFSTILNLVIIAATVVVVIMAIFAPQILQTLYPQALAESPELLPLATRLLRLMLISQIITGGSGVLMVTLNARQHFTLPALAAVLYNVFVIIGTLLFQPSVMGVAYGMLLGSLAHVLIQVPGLLALNVVYRPLLHVNQAVRRVMWLMAPRVLGLAFSYLNPVLTPIIAQTLITGSEASLRYAFRIMLVPQAVIGQALGVAAFPTFAALVVRGSFDEMRRILGDMLRLIFFLGLPITVYMMVLARPLTRIAFQRGTFDAQDTTLVATALFFYATAMIAVSAIEIVSRAFYAFEDTLTPIVAGGVQMALMFGFGLWFGRVLFPAYGFLGLGGVAFGYSIANWLEVAVLVWLLRGKMGGIGAPRLWRGLWRMLAAAAAMALTVAAIMRLGDGLLLVTVAIAIGGIVYLVLCYLLQLDEVQLMLTMLRRRLPF